jgi:glycerate 2-kinase
MPKQFNLEKIWKETLDILQPERLFASHSLGSPDAAWIALGKASSAFWRTLATATDPKAPGLVISHEPRPLVRGKVQQKLLKQVTWIQGEHPVPGAGSFEAGRALSEFIGALAHRPQIKRLNVFLSGGGSSLLWHPPAGLRESDVVREAERLYRMPLPIEELNRRRAKLCVFKAGGAARFLKRVRPDIELKVWVVSDVLPFGPSVVSSGPFFISDQRNLNHTVLADNQIALDVFSKKLKAAGVKTIRCEPTRVELASLWASRVDTFFNARRDGITEAKLWGGEALVSVPVGAKRARGGRLSHLAALVCLHHGPAIAREEISFCALSTDGKDGASQSGGVWLRAGDARLADLGGLKEAIASFDTAAWFAKRGCLVNERFSGTNVQDIVIALKHKSARGV